MKKRLLSLLGLLPLLFACEQNADNNKPLDFDSIQVNYDACLDGIEWSQGFAVALIANCTRNGEENVPMSENAIATFLTDTTGARSPLTPATDADKVSALSSDHNFRFYGISPKPTGTSDLSAIPVRVPASQDYSAGILNQLTLIGKATPVSVVPTISLEMKSVFSILAMNIPNDIVEDKLSTLRKLEITPSNPAWGGYLAPAGTYNATTGVFTQDNAGSGNSITVNFPGEGLSLKDAYTRVCASITPMTIPAGGFSVKFTDVDGTESQMDMLASETEEGKKIAAGETYETFMNAINDGIVPVTFPVVFPLGYPNGDVTQLGNNNAAQTWLADWTGDEAYTSANSSVDWTGPHGKVYCKDQPQAYLTWNWSNEITTTEIKHFIEIVNQTTNKISAFGVKGVWTNDFYEFFIPVRKFKAGSVVTLSMPMFNRNGPIFWEVLYKDGEEWKTTATADLPAAPGSTFKRTATWTVRNVGPITCNESTLQTVSMTFANEIKSGILNIRVKCVDGTIIDDNNNGPCVTDAPNNNAGLAGGPFYFYNPGDRDNQAITISVDN